MTHPSPFQLGHLAVITGGASGIGLAAAKYVAKYGMKVAIIDQDKSRLESAIAELSILTHVIGYHADVSNLNDLNIVAKQLHKDHGIPTLLFANAGIQPGSRMFGSPDSWKKIIDVNFWGVLNTVQAFSEMMMSSGTFGRILITGSKQGITTPPGDPAYNISKAAVKAYAEALAHELRSKPDNQILVHLVIPGFVWTPLTYSGRTEKPSGAWTPDQTIEFVMAAVQKGDFYILCPDNDVTRDIDEKRIAWASGDIIHNRPPLSRWHKDYADTFSDYLKQK